MCLETLMKAKAESAEFQKNLALFFYLYPFIYKQKRNSVIVTITKLNGVIDLTVASVYTL